MSAAASRAGFTLLELTLSMAVSALLMAALGSAMVLAGAALPDENSPETRVLESSRALERLSADLEGAVYILSTAPGAPVVAIPDRNKDAAPDTLALSWSGVRAEPIKLVENGATPETLLDNAASFNAALDTFTTSELISGVDVVSPEQELAAYPTAPTRSDSLRLQSGIGYGQIITPSLPAGATSWTPTKAEYSISKTGNTGSQLRAQLLAVDGSGAPTDTVLSELVFPESDLGKNLAWYEVVFDGAPALTPGASLCLVLAHEAGGAAGEIEVEDGTGVGLWQRDTGGSGVWELNWSPWNMQMLYRLYGTYTSPGASGSVQHNFVTSISIDLTAAGDPDVNLGAMITAINRPQIVDSIWEAEFWTDPTAHDINADGIGDWVRSDAAPFNNGNLDNGIWKAASAIVSSPAKDMTGPVTVKLRWRATTLGQAGARFTFAADQSGGEQAVLRLNLIRTGSPEQTLTLSALDALGGAQILQTVLIPDGGFVDTRMVVAPAINAALLTVNGVPQNAVGYTTRTYAPNERVSVLEPLGSGVEIDSVSIREGGTP